MPGSFHITRLKFCIYFMCHFVIMCKYPQFTKNFVHSANVANQTSSSVISVDDGNVNIIYRASGHSRLDLFLLKAEVLRNISRSCAF